MGSLALRHVIQLSLSPRSLPSWSSVRFLLFFFFFSTHRLPHARPASLTRSLYLVRRRGDRGAQLLHEQTQPGAGRAVTPRERGAQATSRGGKLAPCQRSGGVLLTGETAEGGQYLFQRGRHSGDMSAIPSVRAQPLLDARLLRFW